MSGSYVHEVFSSLFAAALIEAANTTVPSPVKAISIGTSPLVQGDSIRRQDAALQWDNSGDPTLKFCSKSRRPE